MFRRKRGLQSETRGAHPLATRVTESLVVPGGNTMASPPSEIPPMPTGFRPEISRRVPDLPGATRDDAGSAEAKRLIVGRDIVLNGEISACEKLVVEGRVEASLNDCKAIEIAESGTFKGSAEVEEAEISGLFDGSLVVRGRLLVHETGRVVGDVRYDRIEIEPGGVIIGTLNTNEGGAENLPKPTLAAASDAS